MANFCWYVHPGDCLSSSTNDHSPQSFLSSTCYFTIRWRFQWLNSVDQHRGCQLPGNCCAVSEMIQVLNYLLKIFSGHVATFSEKVQSVLPSSARISVVHTSLQWSTSLTLTCLLLSTDLNCARGFKVAGQQLQQPWHQVLQHDSW